MRNSFIIILTFSAFATASAHAEFAGKCTSERVNETMERASKIASIKYHSENLEKEINEVRADIEKCTDELHDDVDGAFEPDRVRLACRLALENGSNPPISCGEYNFDGGDFYDRERGKEEAIAAGNMAVYGQPTPSKAEKADQEDHEESGHFSD